MSTMKPLPTKEEIKLWIKHNGGREAVGKLIGSEKSTVDSWFSTREIPADKHAELARLMWQSDTALPSQSQDSDSVFMIRVPFTDDLLRRTHAAASAVNEDFQPYCEKAITARVEEDEAAGLSSTSAPPHPPLTPQD